MFCNGLGLLAVEAVQVKFLNKWPDVLQVRVKSQVYVDLIKQLPGQVPTVFALELLVVVGRDEAIFELRMQLDLSFVPQLIELDLYSLVKLLHRGFQILFQNDIQQPGMLTKQNQFLVTAPGKMFGDGRSLRCVAAVLHVLFICLLLIGERIVNPGVGILLLLYFQIFLGHSAY